MFSKINFSKLRATEKDKENEAPIRKRAPLPMDLMEYVSLLEKQKNKQKEDEEIYAKKGCKKVTRDGKKLDKRSKKRQDNNDNVGSEQPEEDAHVAMKSQRKESLRLLQKRRH